MTPGEVAERFRCFAAIECDRSPLYRRLAEGIAQDAELVALAGRTQPSQPIPNMLLAAAHDLLLAGLDHPLARFYPSLTPEAVSGDPLPAFRDLCLGHAGAIAERLASRRVQTNEVARCACLLPALALAGRDRPLALIDVGASAGLHLLWDRYAYEYSDGRRFGPAASRVRLRCELRGQGRPGLPDGVTAATRLGIDIHPVDMRDPEAARWLLALVWPDQPERAVRLRAAMAVASADPPRLVAGNALDVLPALIDEAPAGAEVCVLHCHTLNQFSPADRDRFADLLCAAGRPVTRVSIEGAAGEPDPRLTLTRYRGGQVDEVRLGHCDAHGEWLAWGPPAR